MLLYIRTTKYDKENSCSSPPPLRMNNTSFLVGYYRAEYRKLIYICLSSTRMVPLSLQNSNRRLHKCLNGICFPFFSFFFSECRLSIRINFFPPSSRLQVPVVAIGFDFLSPLPSFCTPFQTVSNSLVEVRSFASLFLQDPHHPF